MISDAYADLRTRISSSETDRARTLPITARTLETLIRLSAAHAKCHLRNLITEDDAKAAISLLHYALFAEDHGLEGEIETTDVTGAGLKRPAASGTSERGGRKRRADAAASAQAAPLNENELEEEVERALTLLFAGYVLIRGYSQRHSATAQTPRTH